MNPSDAVATHQALGSILLPMYANSSTSSPFKYPVNRVHTRMQIIDEASANAALQEARHAASRGDYVTAIDLYEQLIGVAPANAVELLSEVYTVYKGMPDAANRYRLYVSRYFDFAIRPTDKVLDIGSGHDPFPLATHLADKAISDDQYGRAGIPLQRVAGKPLVECDVEVMPFADKEFDFIYCSHVLEHSHDPEKACRELMRVGKRGYIETPIRCKDTWLNTAKISNHIWSVESYRGGLIFTEYSTEEQEGLGCNLLMDMHCDPKTTREQAFSALVLLKSRQMNVMFYWEDSFDVRVNRLT